MTCIVGLVHGNRVLIGGDSAGVSGWDVDIRADTKVWATSGWAYGFTTSFRMGQILRYRLEPPKVTGDLDAYLPTTFIDHVRSTLRDSGWLSTTNGRDEGGTFLVGHAGRLFEIDDDLQVGESVHGFSAVGCGAQVARGALYAAPRGLPPRRKVELALEAAAALNMGVRGPFHIVEARA